jgi:hypothetical protein
VPHESLKHNLVRDQKVLKKTLYLLLCFCVETADTNWFGAGVQFHIDARDARCVVEQSSVPMRDGSYSTIHSSTSLVIIVGDTHWAVDSNAWQQVMLVIFAVDSFALEGS